MPGPPTRRRLSTGRTVDRLVNFSDGVVAVAITVLVLPIVDIGGPQQGQTLLDVVSEHASELWTFLFTFFVVAVMWSAHNRILNPIRAYDPFLFWWNTTWLVLIVMLPWVSSMYGEADYGRGGVGFAYWSVLAAISLVGALLSWHIMRHPELTSGPPMSPDDRRRATLRGPVLGGFFLLIGLVSLVAPDVASWLPLGIIPLSIWLRPGAVGDPGETTPAREDP